MKGGYYEIYKGELINSVYSDTEMHVEFLRCLPCYDIIKLASTLIVSTSNKSYLLKTRLYPMENNILDINKLHEDLKNLNYVEISRKDYYGVDFTDFYKHTLHLLQNNSSVIFNISNRFQS